MDVRREVKPDIVADARYLPFRDGTFDQIFCDPPHLIRKSGWAAPIQGSIYFASVRRRMDKKAMGDLVRHSMIRFGFWKSRAEWEDFVANTNKEFKRAMKETGSLEYKICEMKSAKSVGLVDLERMDNFIIAKKRLTKSSIGNKTIWLTMRPKS